MDVALHLLSASKLGLQSEPERIDCRKLLNERSYEIDTKLKLAKRQFKTGLYIEEILK